MNISGQLIKRMRRHVPLREQEAPAWVQDAVCFAVLVGSHAGAHSGIKSRAVLIGDSIREIRQAKNLSQGEVEKRSGLLRAYQSRVECSHTVPSIETLEKWARALEIPLYQFFYEGKGQPRAPLPETGQPKGLSRKEMRELERFRKLLAKMSESDRLLLLDTARKMASR